MVARTNRFRWVLMLPLIFILSGCPFDPKDDKKPSEPDEPEYAPQTSITNVLTNLRQAYINMDYPEYEKLLDEAYVFVFDPDDVGPDTDFQEEWPRGEDLASAQNMFGRQPNTKGQVVDSIELEFVPQTAETSPVNPQWQRVILSAVELTLDTTNQEGDKWYLMTPGGYEAYLHFVQTSEIDQETQQPIWKIVLWEDKPPSTKRLIASN